MDYSEANKILVGEKRAFEMLGRGIINRLSPSQLDALFPDDPFLQKLVKEARDAKKNAQRAIDEVFSPQPQ